MSIELWRPLSSAFLASIGVDRDAADWRVSNHGRVARDGEVVEPFDRPLARGKTTQPAIEMAPGVTPLVCRLVAEAWVPNPHGSTSPRRISTDPTNPNYNRPENLYWKLGAQSSRSRVEPLGVTGSAQWVAVQGAPGYEVSSEGEMRKDGKPFRPLIRRGEPTVFLYVGSRVFGRRVKDLVAQAFLPRPMGHAALSRVAGADPRSCRAEDLLWVAAGGRGGRSRLPRRAKLTRDQALEIRRRAAAGERQTELAAEFGVTQAAVSMVVTRRTWR